MNPAIPFRRAAGFSLIEMLVAMVILALSLGVLYQAAAGATRNVRMDERYTYAVQIAQSLLAEYPFVKREGVSASGVMGDLRWQLRSEPYTEGLPALAADSDPEAVPTLHQLEAVVRWEGSEARELRLVTLVPEFDPAVLEQVFPEAVP